MVPLLSKCSEAIRPTILCQVFTYVIDETTKEKGLTRDCRVENEPGENNQPATDLKSAKFPIGRVRSPRSAGFSTVATSNPQDRYRQKSLRPKAA